MRNVNRYCYIIKGEQCSTKRRLAHFAASRHDDSVAVAEETKGHGVDLAASPSPADLASVDHAPQQGLQEEQEVVGRLGVQSATTAAATVTGVMSIESSSKQRE